MLRVEKIIAQRHGADRFSRRKKMNALDTTLAVMKAWEDRDLNATARLLADNFVVVGPAPEALGKDAYLGFQSVHNAAFADWKFNVKDTRVEGDKVYVTIQIHATQTGPYDVSKLGIPLAPIPATGKSRDWPVEHLTATVKNGLVTELDVKSGPTGGVMGTLEWLGAPLPQPA
jgi:ketosteroid isomerase-like protein